LPSPPYRSPALLASRHRPGAGRQSRSAHGYPDRHGATTLLRRIRELEPPLPPRVLGVDDWAWRKGQSYGTILCDLERGRRVDLLPDRTAETLAAWLKDHPSVEIVVRDRAGAYAEGARQGAPQAIQVADRWHLLRNGSDALRGVLDHHHRHLDEAAQIAAASLTDEPAANDNTLDAASAQDTGLPVTKAEQRSLNAQQRRDARFEEAVRLREQGMTIRGIARALGVGRKTVRRWLRMLRPGGMPTAAVSIPSAITWRHAGPRAVVTGPGCGGRSASAASLGNQASAANGLPADAVRTRPRIRRHRPSRPNRRPRARRRAC
jgi:DNA-binding transcriptional regulator YiaG